MLKQLNYSKMLDSYFRCQSLKCHYGFSFLLGRKNGYQNASHVRSFTDRGSSSKPNELILETFLPEACPIQQVSLRMSQMSQS